MVTDTDERAIARRRLILRDSLSILSLSLITVVLFLATLLLFRSFSSHREDLAQRWSDRGRTALAAGKPGEAIGALRTALVYAPGKREYELSLAQALGEAGQIDASYNYFLGLRESEPGDGFVNLELARLAAKRNERRAAVNYYRASIYGTWEGDGVARRAEVRLELARYLIEQKDPAAARMELLIAGGNAPDDFQRDLAIGNLLQQAADAADAVSYYRKAVADKPADADALETAGRLDYDIGDYEDARQFLSRAQTVRVGRHEMSESANDATMAHDAARLLELMPSNTLPVQERVARILTARTIAKRRFEACGAQLAPNASQRPMLLQSLSGRWSGPEGTDDAKVLRQDDAKQDATVRLVYDTEVETQKLCGAATGDDALLLRLATTAPNSQPAAVDPGHATFLRSDR